MYVTLKLGRSLDEAFSRVAQSTWGAVASFVSTIRHPKLAADSTHAWMSLVTSLLTHPDDEGTDIVALPDGAREGCVFQVRPDSVQADWAGRSS